jgi:hypothetical protein
MIHVPFNKYGPPVIRADTNHNGLLVERDGARNAVIIGGVIQMNVAIQLTILRTFHTYLKICSRVRRLDSKTGIRSRNRSESIPTLL